MVERAAYMCLHFRPRKVKSGQVHEGFSRSTVYFPLPLCDGTLQRFPLHSAVCGSRYLGLFAHVASAILLLWMRGHALRKLSRIVAPSSHTCISFLSLDITKGSHLAKL